MAYNLPIISMLPALPILWFFYITWMATYWPARKNICIKIMIPLSPFV